MSSTRRIKEFNWSVDMALEPSLEYQEAQKQFHELLKGLGYDISKEEQDEEVSTDEDLSDLAGIYQDAQEECLQDERKALGILYQHMCIYIKHRIEREQIDIKLNRLKQKLQCGCKRNKREPSCANS